MHQLWGEQVAVTSPEPEPEPEPSNKATESQATPAENLIIGLASAAAADVAKHFGTGDDTAAAATTGSNSAEDRTNQTVWVKPAQANDPVSPTPKPMAFDTPVAKKTGEASGEGEGEEDDVALLGHTAHQVLDGPKDRHVRTHPGYRSSSVAQPFGAHSQDLPHTACFVYDVGRGSPCGTHFVPGFLHACYDGLPHLCTCVRVFVRACVRVCVRACAGALAGWTGCRASFEWLVRAVIWLIWMFSIPLHVVALQCIDHGSRAAVY